MILRNRITIQENEETLSVSNDRKENWVTKYKAWAKVVPAGGREFSSNGQTLADVDCVITLRGRNDISVKTRILWRHRGKERVFDVKAVDNFDARGRFLTIQATEHK